VPGTFDGPRVRVAGTAQDSIVDGPGLRFAVFAQGCVRRCPGCHNPQTHRLDGGELRGVDGLWGELRGNPLTTGLTLSGGEPFLQARPLAELARRAKGAGLGVWAFTGFYLYQLLRDEDHMELLRCTDVLVDGPFVQGKKTLGLPWRGSSNQRLVDVQAFLSRKAGYVIDGE